MTITFGQLASHDFGLLIFSGLLLFGYQWYLWHRTRRDPMYTVQAVNTIARTAWVESIMADANKAVLAVQTLRNSTMAATFLASTAVLLMIGTLTLTSQRDQHSSLLSLTHYEIWAVKLMLLLVDFVVAFFSFAMAIRIFNHVGYMINVPLSVQRGALAPQHVASHLNRAGRYYSLGMRAYYIAVPLVFWLFGPQFMLLSTVALIIVLYRIDRAPRVRFLESKAKADETAAEDSLLGSLVDQRISAPPIKSRR